MRMPIDNLIAYAIYIKVQMKLPPEVMLEDIEKYAKKIERYMKVKNKSYKLDVGMNRIKSFLDDNKDLFKLFNTEKGNGIRLIDSTLIDEVRVKYLAPLNVNEVRALTNYAAVQELL